MSVGAYIIGQQKMVSSENKWVKHSSLEGSAYHLKMSERTSYNYLKKYIPNKFWSWTTERYIQ